MKVEKYKSKFENFIKGLQDEPQALKNVRSQAFDDFLKIGFPSRKEEAWQYTDLAPIIDTDYELSLKNGSKISKDIIENILIPNSNHLILINGRLSELSNLDKKLIIKNYSEGWSNGVDLIPDNKNAFVALNKAFAQNGYILKIPYNYDSGKPIHIINILTGDKDNLINNQLNIISTDKNSSAVIIEEYINYSEKNIFNNVVNKIDLGKNSNLNYVTFQDNKTDAKEIHHFYINQADDSNFNAQFISKNGLLIRNEIDLQIKGQNVDSNIFGIGLLDGNDHIENYTNVIHHEPHCNSRQLFKYILKDSSEGVFNGLVKVQPDAQQTDSQQTNKNILLSKKALMNSNPQLEIYADDVKCTHGSATGELDEDAIFYLRSRGLDLITAKKLLIEGFAKEIFEQVKNEPFKERINKILTNWLAK